MKKLLLTSSQVSVVVTSVIVLMCTLALFLSGYAIQQRTVNELRDAIKAPPNRHKPKMYLPDYFKKPDPEVPEFQGHSGNTDHIEIRPTPSNDAPSPHDHDIDNTVSAKMDIVEQLKAQVAAKTWMVEHPDPLVKNRVPIDAFERRKLIREEIQRLSTIKTKVGYQRRLW